MNKEFENLYDLIKENFEYSEQLHPDITSYIVADGDLEVVVDEQLEVVYISIWSYDYNVHEFKEWERNTEAYDLQEFNEVICKYGYLPLEDWSNLEEL